MPKLQLMPFLPRRARRARRWKIRWCGFSFMIFVFFMVSHQTIDLNLNFKDNSKNKIRRFSKGITPKYGKAITGTAEPDSMRDDVRTEDHLVLLSTLLFDVTSRQGAHPIIDRIAGSGDSRFVAGLIDTLRFIPGFRQRDVTARFPDSPRQTARRKSVRARECF